MIDGAPFVVEQGAAGDHRFVHGAAPDTGGAPVAQTLAVHHLSADRSVLRCAPSNQADPSWWRVVLDSVLFTIALLHGYEALHAGAIAVPGGAVAITADTGGGKSTLLAELVGRGSALVADDVLALEPRDGESPLAHPGPPLMTVPAVSLPALGAAEPTEAISSIDDERWIAIPAYPRSLPLKALVVLDRRPNAQLASTQPSLTKIEGPLVALLSALMRFPPAAERQRARFELASTIASTVGLWRFTAPLQTPASALADMLLAANL
ncbi:MAG TPA: hypothetical protein VK680_03345 [Solirubrobacteraceae bacterium]|nr:hypothetical protein [Solirubrobacteraceae bacterium]